MTPYAGPARPRHYLKHPARTTAAQSRLCKVDCMMRSKTSSVLTIIRLDVYHKQGLPTSSWSCSLPKAGLLLKMWFNLCWLYLQRITQIVIGAGPSRRAEKSALMSRAPETESPNVLKVLSRNMGPLSLHLAQRSSNRRSRPS